MFLCQSKIDSVSWMLLVVKDLYNGPSFRSFPVNCCDLIYCLILHFHLVNKRNVKWKGTIASYKTLYGGLSGSKFSFPVLLCYCAILSFCYDVLSFCFNILSFFYWDLMCSYVMLLCYCAILLFRYDVLSFYFNILSYCY